MEIVRWGRRIRAFRRLKMIKQVELAKEMDMSVSILGKIEQGKRVPTEKQLEKIAAILDIKLEELKGVAEEGEE
ncbi:MULTISPECIES: helix-turn-helix domain-containing protein [Psychrobacillus]|uniref:Helix-turn-helix transcriptional regulator n=2 Tax=Psychrobacillus TaxID=1221880 RepID=A0ABR8REJ3_9BACI|nr:MULTISPECIES: helix-turn-helix transcriptional regulator [Psychrobacillus]MBD7946234.1 helix-turn-helix transcriptional regulator [Psychrobacillus faecigallinarum]QEY21314.1 XRE family transcriptional regulator [Psychrobacillus sp. AK 1817]QGM31828.1 helix-turn-helix domain-containing protein [Bacillus sp. N3536]